MVQGLDLFDPLLFINNKCGRFKTVLNNTSLFVDCQIRDRSQVSHEKGMRSTVHEGPFLKVDGTSYYIGGVTHILSNNGLIKTFLIIR